MCTEAFCHNRYQFPLYHRYHLLLEKIYCADPVRPHSSDVIGVSVHCLLHAGHCNIHKYLFYIPSKLVIQRRSFTWRTYKYENLSMRVLIHPMKNEIIRELPSPKYTCSIVSLQICHLRQNKTSFRIGDWSWQLRQGYSASHTTLVKNLTVWWTMILSPQP